PVRRVRASETHLTRTEATDPANLHSASPPPSRCRGGTTLERAASMEGVLVFVGTRVLDAGMANETTVILPALRDVIDSALEIGRRLTDGGKSIDDHQVHAERLAYAATEVRAAEALAEYAAGRRAAGSPDNTTDLMAAAFAAEAAGRLVGLVQIHRDDFGVPDGVLGRTLTSPEVAAAVRAAQHESRF